MISDEYNRENRTSALPIIPPPPPPPPPPSLQQAKTTQTTQKSMKKINWQKLTANALSKDCFWAKIKNCELYSEDIFDGLDDQFSLPSRKVVDNSTAKPKINLRVLDVNKAQNLLISLRSLFKNASHEEIKQHILRCDTDILTSTFVEGLIKCLPEPHRMEQLREMNNAGVELLDVEKFISSLGDIKRLIPRLHSINFKLNYNDMVEFIESNISVGISACEEVVSSKKFDQILELILAIGNRLNFGTASGAAVGFELTVLAKLNDVKGNVENLTLMHFLVQTIEKKFPKLLDFDEEILHVDEAACLNVGAIEENLGKIATSSESLQKALNDANVFHDNIFIEMMTPFSLENCQKVDVLREQMNRMQDCYRKVGEYYAFDICKCSMKEFFSAIKSFKNSFTKARTQTIKAPKRKALVVQQHQVCAGTFVMFVVLK